MQRILVTGGLGKLGKPVLMALRNRGFQIRALRLPQERPPQGMDPEMELVQGDIADPSSIRGIATGMDAVLHAAAILQTPNSADFERINHQGTVNLLAECQRASIQHFILVSSISVTYPILSAYAQSKVDAEKAVMATGIPMKTVVRPTLIYDDEGGASEFAALVRYVARFPLVFLPGGGLAHKRPVHAADAAECLAAIPMVNRTASKTYALAGGEILTLRNMVETIAQILQCKRSIISIPKWISQLGALAAQAIQPGGNMGLQGLYGLLQNAAPQIHELQADLGYAPRTFQPTRLSLEMALHK